ncbi:MAG: RHS repeat-associated core domain-containing protein, partial [bacterium]|nr:RHS repeat-associated core domain-containing protein [bacterium]
YYFYCLKAATWAVINPSASAAASFTYDGDGGRVQKTDSSGSTVYIGSLFEKGSDGLVRKNIFAGANRIATKSLRGASAASDEVISYYHSDHLGSSNVITDQNGNQVGLTEFSPYGSVSKQTGSYDPKFKFTGKELDNTGLYFYGARYYDPQIGRFITADPTIQQPYDPQDLNRFAYCRNNPINLIDPNGLGFKNWFKHFFAENAGLIGILTGFAGLLIGSIYTGNWQPFQNIATATATAFLFSGFNPVVAAATFMATSVTSTHPGQEVVKWTGKEIFDDAFGMSPGAAYMCSSITINVALSLGFEAAFANMVAEPATATQWDRSSHNIKGGTPQGKLYGPSPAE